MKKSSKYERQAVQEVRRKAKAWDKNKIETVLTIELAWKLRSSGFYVKPFQDQKNKRINIMRGLEEVTGLD